MSLRITQEFLFPHYLYNQFSIKSSINASASLSTGRKFIGLDYNSMGINNNTQWTESVIGTKKFGTLIPINMFSYNEQLLNCLISSRTSCRISQCQGVQLGAALQTFVMKVAAPTAPDAPIKLSHHSLLYYRTSPSSHFNYMIVKLATY